MHTLIVGAGAAGCVLAARISESSQHEVTLLEAGPDYREASLPNDLVDGRRNSMRDHDWGYTMKPTPRQKMPFAYPRGRVIGGSSAVNTCIFLRGHRYDYDEWASLGLHEWSFDQCLPAFLRVENDLDCRGPYHAQNGPISVRRHAPSEWNPWQAAFVETAHALGFARVDDHNDPSQSTGVGPHTMNRIDGVRISARKYLSESVRARNNLRIVSDSHARRVVFHNRTAQGVEVDHQGQIITHHADRVVLAAGAIGSLGILLRSGVGPVRDVTRLRVELVAESPTVGARLLDHPGTAMVFAPRLGVSNVEDPLLQTLLRWTASGSSTPGDLQTQPGSNFPLPGITYPLVSLMTTIGKPRGHCEVHFDSAEPLAKPTIVGNFLEHPDDLRLALEGAELMSRLARTAPLSKLAFPLFPRRSILVSRDQLREFLPIASGSGYHPCGTIPMTSGDPQAGAVDGRGNLLGVRGVIVADASIMPTIVSANTHLPTLMIAERIAEWLRDG